MEEKDIQFLPSSKSRRKTPKVGCMRSITDYIPARLVLYFLSWSGFLVSFMMRNDINFALVAMVKDTNTNSSSNDHCAHPPSSSKLVGESESNFSSPLNSSLLTEFGTEETTRAIYGEFEWDSTVQAVIKGSFYWCYVISQVVGGVATQYFGTKCVWMEPISNSSM